MYIIYTNGMYIAVLYSHPINFLGTDNILFGYLFPEDPIFSARKMDQDSATLQSVTPSGSRGHGSNVKIWVGKSDRCDKNATRRVPTLRHPRHQ